MIMDFKELFNGASEKKSFDYEIATEELKDITLVSFDTPISVKGETVNRAGVVSLSYAVRFTLNHDCDRCLSRFTRDFAFDFRHTVVRSLNDNVDDDEYVIAENDKLDLSELVISDLLLQLPSKMLCKEDCKGLCSICGADLNVSECNCPRQ